MARVVDSEKGFERVCFFLVGVFLLLSALHANPRGAHVSHHAGHDHQQVLYVTKSTRFSETSPKSKAGEDVHVHGFCWQIPYTFCIDISAPSLDTWK